MLLILPPVWPSTRNVWAASATSASSNCQAERAGSGAGDIAFVIGSSHGLDDRVKKAAQARISMGRITLPHQLARLVLTEQLYRACTINAGMKYHK